MRLRSSVHGLATVACVALSAVAATSASAADCQDLTWSQDRLSKFDVAIAAEQDAANRQDPAREATHRPQDQVSGIDAAIAALEQDVATRKGDAAARGEAVLKEIRSRHDAYRAKLKRPHLVTPALADTSQSPEESTNALWDKVNAYLDAVNADISTRQAATQSMFMGN